MTAPYALSTPPAAAGTGGPSPDVLAPSAGRLGTGQLALLLQDALTAIARLRAGRQAVPDAAAFRAHITQLLGRADADARAAGFSPEDVRLGIFAVVALLDESALNARQPALADWARRPLQDELFGNHLAGEWFYQHVEQLLSRPDSAMLADLLEVHQLCLLLGFRGRHGGDVGALHAVSSRIAERLGRLTGNLGPMSPSWRPPADSLVQHDPWTRRLTVALAASVVLAIALWGAGALTLGDGPTAVRSLVAAPTARS
jgi:type VI secretion system protein ImpK